jgi:hypothetical protein
MSYSFRERLRIALRQKLKEKLSLSEKDIKFLWENIGTFCSHSDELIDALKKYENSGKTIDEIVDELDDQDFEDLVKETIEHGFKKLNYKKQKDATKEKETDTDSDSDSDADDIESEAQEAETEEVECSED